MFGDYLEIQFVMVPIEDAIMNVVNRPELNGLFSTRILEFNSPIRKVSQKESYDAVALSEVIAEKVLKQSERQDEEIQRDNSHRCLRSSAAFLFVLPIHPCNI